MKRDDNCNRSIIHTFSPPLPRLPPPPTLHRRSRETGLHEEVELEEHEALFDYVEEEEYARLIQQRQEEGFILDDGE